MVFSGEHIGALELKLLSHGIDITNAKLFTNGRPSELCFLVNRKIPNQIHVDCLYTVTIWSGG